MLQTHDIINDSLLAPYTMARFLVVCKAWIPDSSGASSSFNITISVGESVRFIVEGN